MNAKAETTGSAIDIVKLVIAAAIVIAAIAGFYIFSEASLLFRVIGLLLCVGIASAIASYTTQGRNLWAFVHDSQIEVRKVVWPTRQETTTTTLIVVAMVIVIAIMLWIIDWFLGWAVSSIIG